MTDRELLELAAKAAGVEFMWGKDWHNRGCPLAAREYGRKKDWFSWNPLDDDGDALRLAVKLKLKMYQAETAAICHRRMAQDYIGESYDDNGMDKMAATRRAIVRAAAEIGKQL